LEITASIFARVSSFTNGDWLMTRDTVFFDTLARRAMSLMVARRPRRLGAAGRTLASSAPPSDRTRFAAVDFAFAMPVF
jgi:hypothetical protein